MKRNIDELSEFTKGILTEPMDSGTKEYEDFKLLIRSKVAETSKEDRIQISLLGLKYHMNITLNQTQRKLKWVASLKSS